MTLQGPVVVHQARFVLLKSCTPELMLNTVLFGTWVVVNVESITTEETRSELNPTCPHFFKFFQFVGWIIGRWFTNGPTMCTPFLPLEFALCVTNGSVSCADVTLASAALAEQALCKSLLVNFPPSKGGVLDTFADPMRSNGLFLVSRFAEMIMSWARDGRVVAA